MLRHEHFDIKGGERKFAAGAGPSCRDIGTRHSANLEAVQFSAPPQGGSEPLGKIFLHGKSEFESAPK